MKAIEADNEDLKDVLPRTLFLFLGEEADAPGSWLQSGVASTSS
jgi:hypothetical protein